jgi:hypothetical protein
MADRAEPAQYSYGEAPVRASVASSQRATPDQLVAMAFQIWQRIASAKVAKSDDAGNDRLLEAIQADYKDFSTSFPLVLRWMVQLRKFSAKAFRKYLLMHATANLDSRRAFLELQAEYLVLLYREEHLHPDESSVRKYRDSVVETLLEEDKTFLAIQKQVEEDLARVASDMDRDRRQRLYEHLVAQKVARESAACAKPGGQ